MVVCEWCQNQVTELKESEVDGQMKCEECISEDIREENELADDLRKQRKEVG